MSYSPNDHSTHHAGQAAAIELVPNEPPKKDSAYMCFFRGCDKCGTFEYKDQRGRERHMDSHFPPMYRCSKCHLLHKRRDQIGIHVRKCGNARVVELRPQGSYWLSPESADQLVRPRDDDPIWTPPSDRDEEKLAKFKALDWMRALPLE